MLISAKTPLKFEKPGNCCICNSKNIEKYYQGEIRVGSFGQSMEGTVYRCNNCSAQILGIKWADINKFYSSGDYRELLGQTSAQESFFEIHDSLQFERMPILETLLYRGSVVADVGCGGGSMLDLMRGFASTSIAIEPTKTYHKSLKERGHYVYPFTRDALKKWRGKIDLVTSFSVIEHVENPVEFLSEQRQLLKPSGKMLISTPNIDELMMRVGCTQYKAFNYRLVHLFYFNAESLQKTAEQAGFKNCRILYKHRFNFSNFITWINEGKPSGNNHISSLGFGFDPQWRAILESAGQSDYLYAELSN